MNPDTQEQSPRVVVIGAGHGGGSVVAFLRQYGFKGAITLIGDEPFLPYHRPPLSKAWLKGEVEEAALFFKPESFYAEQDIDLRLGQQVETLLVARRELVLVDGARVPYDKLVIATGATARPLGLPGADADNVMTLRNIADAEKLKRALGPGKKVVIVGGGYVGLECAATARFLGADVLVLERAERLLERVASAPIAAFLQHYHAERGVAFELGATVTGLEGGERAEQVVLADGRRFPCDVVVVGIGAIPATALAAAAGIACDDGILVNEQAETSEAGIYAIGDATRRDHPRYHRIRLESVPNAMEQAKLVACAIVGRAPPAAEVVWFWSDQYDLKLQIAGLAVAGAQLVVRGDPATGKFAVFHLQDGRVKTVEAINAPQEFFAGKRMIGTDGSVDAGRLADVSVPLSQIVA